MDPVFGSILTALGKLDPLVIIIVVIAGGLYSLAQMVDSISVLLGQPRGSDNFAAALRAFESFLFPVLLLIAGCVLMISKEDRFYDGLLLVLVAIALHTVTEIIRQLRQR